MNRSAAILTGVLTIVLMAGGGTAAQQRSAPSSAPAAAAPAFGPQWRVLIGNWAGDGGGQPGATAGTTSYRFEVGERAIIRTNRAVVAAAAGRPAGVHEDLLVIYAGAKPGEARALYVDNEDHVIHYAAVWSADGKTLTFVSDAQPGAPRFRMTYRIQTADQHALEFAIAPPGSPDAFTPYVSGSLKRQ